MLRDVNFVLLALVLGATACERPETAAPPGAEPHDAAPAASDPAMERTSECRNPVEGYVVRYPAEWHTNPDDILGPCMLFAPERIEVPRNSELPIDIAMILDFAPVPFETLTGEVMGRRVISREETTVDGRQAMRILGETTGEGLHDAGIRYYEYFVDLGDTTFVASTYDAGTPPFERRRRILDAMMATFDFVRRG